MRYIKPTAVESPTVGNLYQAREWKRRAWKGIQECRRRLRDARLKLDGSSGRARLDLLKAERMHFEASQSERACLAIIEQRANELGMTTIRAKAIA
jgi:hypothetical protein